MTPLGYGIDFGTTNSGISVATSHDVTLVPLGEGITVPSILYLDTTGNRSVGDLAVRTHLVNGAGYGRLMSSIKSWLTDESFTTTEAPDGTSMSMSDLVAAILGHLKAAADRFAGATCDRVVLGRPVVFAGAVGPRFEARTKLAVGRLTEAARSVGFREIHLLDESTAALQGEEIDEGIVVSVDFGGGTFDVSVVEATPTQWRVLSTHGVAVGGEAFDSLLFDHAVAPVLRLDVDHVVRDQLLPVPNSLRRIRTLSGTLEMMSDDAAQVTLENWRHRLPELNTIVTGGHGYAFYRAVEAAKIDLSDRDQSRVDFGRPGVRVSAPVARSDFEALVRPALETIGETIDDALKDASIDPTDVSLVLRTGGSSRVPAFVRLLEERFGSDRVAERDSFATVTRGLGYHAARLWGRS